MTAIEAKERSGSHRPMTDKKPHSVSCNCHSLRQATRRVTQLYDRMWLRWICGQRSTRY